MYSSSATPRSHPSRWKMENAFNKSLPSRMRFSGPTVGNSTRSCARQLPYHCSGWRLTFERVCVGRGRSRSRHGGDGYVGVSGGVLSDPVRNGGVHHVSYRRRPPRPAKQAVRANDDHDDSNRRQFPLNVTANALRVRDRPCQPLQTHSSSSIPISWSSLILISHSCKRGLRATFLLCSPAYLPMTFVFSHRKKIEEGSSVPPISTFPSFPSDHGLPQL